MATEKAPARPSNHPSTTARPAPTTYDGVTGEREASIIPRMLGTGASRDWPGLVSALSHASPDARVRIVGQLQRTLGNARVQRLVTQSTGARAIQRAPEATPNEEKHFTIDPDVVAQMRGDVDRIIAILKQQIMTANDESLALFYVKNWASWDDDFRSVYQYQGTPYLDRFLLMLQTTSYTRRTARSMWVEQHALVYDDLWHELEDGRLDEFKRIVAGSKQGTNGPTVERQESAWSFIGKREAIGFWGVLKTMGTKIVGGTVDTAIWLTWKQTGWPLNQVLEHMGVKKEDLFKEPAQLTPFLAKNFDETAKYFSTVLGVDLNEPLLRGGKLGIYDFGQAAGNVPAALTMAGGMGALTEAGGAAEATQGAKELAAGAKVFGAVQAAQSGEKLYDRVAELRKGDPKKGIQPMSWFDIVKRPDVWADVVGVVGSGISSVGGFAGSSAETVKTFQRLGIGTNGVQISILVAAYFAVDSDPTLKTPAEKTKRKAELLAKAVTTGTLTINTAYGKAFKESWEKKLQEGTGQKTAAVEDNQSKREAAVQSPASDGNGQTGNANQGQGSGTNGGMPDWYESTSYAPVGDVSTEPVPGLER